jgi:hypothetical protein
VDRVSPEGEVGEAAGGCERFEGSELGDAVAGEEKGLEEGEVGEFLQGRIGRVGGGGGQRRRGRQSDRPLGGLR